MRDLRSSACPPTGPRVAPSGLKYGGEMTDDATADRLYRAHPRHPRETAEGDQFGVVGPCSRYRIDVFDGITVRTDAGLRFCDADTRRRPSRRRTCGPRSAPTGPAPAGAGSSADLRVDPDDDTGFVASATASGGCSARASGSRRSSHTWSQTSSASRGPGYGARRPGSGDAQQRAARRRTPPSGHDGRLSVGQDAPR